MSILGATEFIDPNIPDLEYQRYVSGLAQADLWRIEDGTFGLRLEPQGIVMYDTRSNKIIKPTDPKGTAPSAIDWTRTKGFKEEFEERLRQRGYGEMNGPVRGSWEWIMERAFDAIEGREQQVTCPECHHRFMAAIRPDSIVLSKVMDHALGKPKETVEVNGRIEEIVSVLNTRTVGPVIEGYALSEAEIADRRLQIAESND